MLACLVQEKNLCRESKIYAVLDDRMPPPEEHFSKHSILYWHVSQLLAEFPKPAEFIDRALVRLAGMTRHPMDTVEQSTDDASFSLFCPPENLPTFVTYLKDSGLVGGAASANDEVNLTITPAGWNRIDQLSRSGKASKQAFVAMWFANEMADIYDKGIKPAIDESGFEPRQMSFVQHNNKICDEIVAEIRKSRFIVADFSAGQCRKCDECEHEADCKDKVRPRGGVYFEAGFAMGLGIPVIWTVRKDQIDDVHFDTRQYNHIVYDSAEDLRKKLHNRIAATIR